MDKTLLRTAFTAGLIALATVPAGKAHAVAVECAGCVTAINKTTDAVNQVNATLEDIKTLLTTLVNHANQIRLAVGPVTTTATTGTLASQPDFRNLAEIVPDFAGFDLQKGVKIDLGDLGGLKENVNGLLQIYTDASKAKDSIKGGRYLETAADLAKVATRRKRVYSQSIQAALATSYYSQQSVQTAKTTELSLDQDRRGAGTLQDKANNNAKVSMEILARLNHLIAQQAALLQLMGARQLHELPREVQGDEDLQEPPAVRGTASQLFGGQQ